ncbi:MAG: amino acid adenylation domain-containing protein, partial [Bacteroidota bacterium]
MVPRLWVNLDELPLTSNGKIDKKSLPEVEGSALSTKDYVAPGTEVEEQLAEIWQELLGVEKVGIYDNFFELGGHSLLAVRLISKIRELGYAVDIQDIFTYPSIALLSPTLSEGFAGYQVPENGILEGCPYITPSMVSLVNVNQEELESIMDQVPGGGANIQDIYPLSPLQEGFYFHHLMSDRTSGDPYVSNVLLSFSSPDQRAGFIEGLRFVIGRHDVLRTCILSSGLPEALQVVLREADLPVGELSVDESQEILPQIEKEMAPDRLWLDTSEAPMLEAKVADDVANEVYYLVLNHHHLIVDHVGLEKIGQEVSFYLSNKADLLPTPSLYRDFIGQTLNKDKLADTKKYFSDLYGDISAPTYPFNLLDTQVDGSYRIVTAKAKVSPELKDDIRKVSGDLKMTPASLFHAAFGLVVGACSNTDYALFGSVLLGRMHGSKGADTSLGLFINTLPVLLDLSGDASTYISHTNERLQDLISYEQTPLSSVHDWSGISNEVPLFSALLNYRHSASGSSSEDVRDLGFKIVSGEERTNYPLNVFIDDYGDDFGITVKLTDTSIDPSAVISYMEESLTFLLKNLEKGAEMSVAELSVLPDKERHQLLEVFNDTATGYPTDQTVVDLFEAQVSKTPEAIAVVDKGNTLTYKELDERSNQLAHYLNKQGVTSDYLVGICLERGLEMVVGILGILKSGGAYLPIDPEYPEKRIAYMLADSAVDLVLCLDSSRPALAIHKGFSVFHLDSSWKTIDQYPKEKLGRAIAPSSLAYVMYTSGSTGQPKGVMLPHHSMFNLISFYHQLDISSERVGQFTSMSFDVSFLEIFFATTQGGALHVIPSALKSDLTGLTAFIHDHAIETVFFPTSFFHFIGAENVLEELQSLEHIIVAGEQLRLSEITKNALYRIGATLHNHYGPTEAHVVTTKKVDHRVKNIAEELVSIGKPIANTQIHVLNPHHKLVPTGAIGELCIAGTCVARGYLNKDELTSEKFVANPFVEGGRLYKTGDLARWLPDGNIEFIGRKDTQEKVRGYRIELGEIENALSLLPGVRQCCVLARADDHGNKRLVGYVVVEDDLDKEAIQDQLLESLPEYMVPRLWIQLEEMPLTSNGKLDRKALPDVDVSALSAKDYVAPRTEVEEQLAKIWQELLGVEKVGIYDNFFELGGHSLLATRLVSMARKELDVELAIRDVFTHATIAGLGSYLSSREKGTLLPKIVATEERPDQVPLSFSQERLWFLDQLRGSLEYHLPFALRLSGNLDKEALSRSLREVVRRHEVLRTVIYAEAGVGYQQLLSADEWELSSKDLTTDASSLPADIQAFLSAPFGLSTDYMFRSCLYDLGEEECILAGVFHHISSDGWSQGILIEEFVALYHSHVSGKAASLPPLSLQYADYALWQRTHLEGKVIDEELTYW